MYGRGQQQGQPLLAASQAGYGSYGQQSPSGASYGSVPAPAPAYAGSQAGYGTRGFFQPAQAPVTVAQPPQYQQDLCPIPCVIL